MSRLGLLLLLAAGCSGGLPIGDPDGGASCSAWKDAVSCAAHPPCIPEGCPECDGTTSFAGCFDKNGPLPGFACPTLACAPCQGLDDASCTAAANRGCVRSSCCGQFTGCLDPNDPPKVCPAACVDNCATLGEQACNASAGC